ncbi:TonB-dependent hemoglobin/transferrin/lactoferrin family receptor [Agrobacterium larrymoorei]|uniref:TonB-dependent hemoglobin/transferrin/lactoferrin family receptor n=1 Tax=Agrobacterium larrymoorei TaxID=160699 RepID=UPI0030C40690
MLIRGSQSALFVCTALALVFNNVSAQAQTAPPQDGQQPTVLKRIVIKGARAAAGNPAANAASDTPLASVTTAEDIRKKDISNLRDLGNTTEPGVDYVASRPGAAGGTFIRGLGGARIATLIDGIPIPYLETLTRSGSSSPTTGISDSTDSFDFSSLSTIDIVRGADSSRIGSGAMAGAIVLNTLEPDDVIGLDKDWGIIAKTGYDSADRSVSGSAAVAKRVGGTSVLLQGGYKRGHELEGKGNDDIIGTLRTKKNPSDTYQRSVMFKLRQEVEGGHILGFTVERFDKDIDTDLKTLQSSATATSLRPGDYWGYDETKRDRVSIDYRYEAPETGGLIDAASLTPYWQRLTKEAGSFGYRNNGTRYERHNMTEESAFGVTGGTVSTFDTGDYRHTVRFGGNAQIFDYKQYLTSITGAANASQADVPKVEGARLGAYLDDEIAFGNSGFKLTPGVRFDWYDYSPKNSSGFTGNTGFTYFGLPADKSGSRLSPKLLASYELTPDLQLFAQWSMSFRAPTMTELYSNFTNNAVGYTVIGNPTLKDETGNGFELGANYDSGDVTGKLTVFHNRYRNFIDTTSRVTADFPLGYNSWANRESVHISGVEVSSRKEFDNGIFLHGSLAYAYGRDQNNGEFIRTIAPVKAIIGIGYQQETWGTELSGVAAGGMRSDGKPQTFEASGYRIANLTGWWEPETLKGLRVQAGVYNIFDKTYWNAVGVRDINPDAQTTVNQPTAYYTEPGRAFKISLTKTF